MTVLSTKYEDEEWGRMKIFLAVVQSIICLSCFIIAISRISQNRRRDDRFPTSKNHEQYPRTVLFCILCGLFALLISSILLGCFFWAWNIAHQTTIAIVVCRASLLCWSFGQFCCYLSFLFRSIDAFADSKFQISRIATSYVATMLLVYQIAWIIKCVLPFVFWPDAKSLSHFLDSEFRQIQMYAIIPIFICDVFITISMTKLFVSRMVLMMRAQAGFPHDRNLQMMSLHQSLEGNGINHQRMQLSVKITVLSITSLIPSLIFVALDAVAIYLDEPPLLVLICWFWLQIDTIITSLCLTLLMERTHGLYRRLCCCCITIGYRCVKRRLFRNDDRNDSESSRSWLSTSISGVPSESKSESNKVIAKVVSVNGIKVKVEDLM